MELPSLPKKIKNDEAKFGLKFRKWIEVNYSHIVSCPLETKDSRGKSDFPFAEVKEPQRHILMKAKSDKGVLIRVQTGTPGAPDYNFYRNSPAFVVIKYPRGFEMIDIENFIREDKKSKKRSLSYARAGEISVLSVKLK